MFWKALSITLTVAVLFFALSSRRSSKAAAAANAALKTQMELAASAQQEEIDLLRQAVDDLISWKNELAAAEAEREKTIRIAADDQESPTSPYAVITPLPKSVMPWVNPSGNDLDKHYGRLLRQ